MRILICLTLFLSACSPLFKLSTSQGNVIEEEKLAQVEVGMTQEQVTYLLGSPLVQDEFEPNRWDYVSYYRSGYGEERHRIISLYFDGQRLSRIEDSKKTADTEQSSSES